MREDTEELEISFGFDLGDGGRADAGGWPSWEQGRTRGFALAGPLTIGDGRLGSVANLEMSMECRRTAAGFEGKWELSMEERIGPHRIDRGQATGYLIDAQNARVLSFAMPQFARACGTRRHKWSGSLTREQFDRITSFASDGDATVRRC